MAKVLYCCGNFSIPNLRIAKAGDGGVRHPVVSEMNENTLFQKPRMCGYFHKIWSRDPEQPHLRQHLSSSVCVNFASQTGLKYHLWCAPPFSFGTIAGCALYQMLLCKSIRHL